MNSKTGFSVLILLLSVISFATWADNRSKAFEELDRETGRTVSQPQSSSPQSQQNEQAQPGNTNDAAASQSVGNESAGQNAQTNSSEIKGAEYNDSVCGTKGYAPCGMARATNLGKKLSACPGNSQFDPIDGGSCWQCPPGTNRALLNSVKSAQACVKPAGESLQPAHLYPPKAAFLGVKTDCGSGKLDPLAGVCFTCPNGYNRTGNSVRTNQACSRYEAAVTTSAQLVASLACPPNSDFDLIDGGTCWSCPSGYSRSWSPVNAIDACTTSTFAGLGAGACKQGYTNINGLCQTFGDCGTENNRPCTMAERFPMCIKGLVPDLLKGTCVVPVPPAQVVQAVIDDLRKKLDGTMRDFKWASDIVVQHLERIGKTPNINDQVLKALNQGRGDEVARLYQLQSLLDAMNQARPASGLAIMPVNPNLLKNSYGFQNAAYQAAPAGFIQVSNPVKRQDLVVAAADPKENYIFKSMTVSGGIDGSSIFALGLEFGVAWNTEMNDFYKNCGYLSPSYGVGITGGIDGSVGIGFWVDRAAPGPRLNGIFTPVESQSQGFTVAGTYGGGASFTFLWGYNGAFQGFEVRPSGGVSAEAEYVRSSMLYADGPCNMDVSDVTNMKPPLL